MNFRIVGEGFNPEYIYLLSLLKDYLGFKTENNVILYDRVAQYENDKFITIRTNYIYDENFPNQLRRTKEFLHFDYLGLRDDAIKNFFNALKTYDLFFNEEV